MKTKKSLLTVNVELNHKPKKNGLHHILIRLTLNRKHKRISTGIYVKESHCNDKANFGRWVTKHPQSKYYNSFLEKSIQQYQKSFLDLSLKQTRISFSDVIKNLDQNRAALFSEISEQFLKTSKKTKAIGTYLKLRNSIGKFKAFLDYDISLFEINVSLLNNYMLHLEEIGNSPNTINKDLKGIGTMYSYAAKISNSEDRIKLTYNNPFKLIKLPSSTPNKNRYTSKQMDDLKNLAGLTKPEQLARDIFLFCY